MKKLTFGLIICFVFNIIDCTKIDEKKPILSDFSYTEQKTNDNQIYVEREERYTIQTYTMDENILPKIEITVENIFAEFPKTPDYFIENDFAVTIKRIDNWSSPYPSYFGMEPVYVTGENFQIIYATDNGYEIRRVTLKGKSIFSYWNQYFGTTRDDVIKAWGEESWHGAYACEDNGDLYAVMFAFDEITYKIIEINISKAP